MQKVTVNGVIEAPESENEIVQNCLSSHSKDLHYLAFDRQLFGFSPLGSWLSESKNLIGKSEEIFNELCKKREVCSLYPEENLTLYPIIKVEEGNFYNIDLNNIEKNFNDILELNDKHYKTKYMVVDFGHTPNNLNANYGLIIESLQSLLKKSKKLEAIYLFDIV